MILVSKSAISLINCFTPVAAALQLRVAGFNPSMSTAVFGSRLISMLYITILYLITIYVGPGLYTVNNHIINHYYNNIIIIPSLLTIFNHF